MLAAGPFDLYRLFPRLGVTSRAALRDAGSAVTTEKPERPARVQAR